VKFTAAPIAGAFVVDIERMDDGRGFFARTFCRDEFAARGLRSSFVQCNLSSNPRKGTLRGMHLQAKPHEEAKLVCCTRGAVYDVIVDLRRESSTFRQWAAFELSAQNRRMLYVPEGLAHGFQALEDYTDLFYLMSESYQEDLARGVRWNDPAFAIRWPLSAPILSQRDAIYPDFER
jgi:dTDP-4-dehydrorhamnose 3,5-epimerase